MLLVVTINFCMAVFRLQTKCCWVGRQSSCTAATGESDKCGVISGFAKL
jgi:hypothetical protein